MDKDEAREVLRRHLESYRRQSYTRLAALIGKPQTCELTAPSGTSYQIEVEAFWEDNPNGDIHVIGSVDDGGWRAFVPLSEDFIMAPDGSLVGKSLSSR